MPNPLGNLLIILGTGHFSSFRARKVKLTKLLTQPYISVPRQVTFFFFHQLKCQYCFPRQTLWKIIYSYWEEAIFQVSEPESKNQMSHEKKLTFCLSPYRGNSPPVGNSGPGTLHDRKNFCFPPSEIALVLYWG